jgi:DnaJ-class molecular chaperone
MNHYETLGVSNTATQDEIKKAYRKLSLKLHPDKTTDPVSVDKYKSVNEAYAILGNPSDRKKYDFELTHCLDMPNNMGHPLFGGMGMGGIKIFTHEMPPFSIDPSGIDLEEIFTFLNGGLGGLGHGPRMQKPNPIIHNVTIGIDKVLTGTTIPIHVDRWVMDNMTGTKTTETETLYVDIPKGIDDSEMITLIDKGHVVSDHQKGDVRVLIFVQNDSNFERKGLDLIYTHRISLKESLCGFMFDITHLNGKVYSINNSGGKVIPDNYTTTLNNMGLTRNEHTGNMVIKFAVDFPATLTPVQIDAIKKIL